MRPSHRETDNFVNRALRPEALSIVESVRARGSRAMEAVGGNAKEWNFSSDLMKQSLQPQPPPSPTPTSHSDFDEGIGFHRGGFRPMPHGEYREGGGRGPGRPRGYP